MKPKVKILAVSNVYSRLMHFLKAGDQEQGHYHDYDHGTLLASGKLLVEKIDDNNDVYFSKEFIAPTFIMIEKNARHIITALEDNTVASCIHALREMDDTIVSPDFIIEETTFADTEDQLTNTVGSVHDYFKDRGMEYKVLSDPNDPNYIKTLKNET